MTCSNIHRIPKMVQISVDNFVDERPLTGLNIVIY
jgi:hypothetical protein